MNHKEFIIGEVKEDDFSKLFTSVTKSTTSEDIYEHWDLKITAKIDVKSIKKQARGDIFYNENFHWIETMNVNGERGWLYGDADFFAFETIDYWIINDKLSLQKFIEDKTKDKVVGSLKDPYELYRRANRKDIVTKVKTLDLFYLAKQIIKKQL